MITLYMSSVKDFCQVLPHLYWPGWCIQITTKYEVRLSLLNYKALPLQPTVCIKLSTPQYSQFAASSLRKHWSVHGGQHLFS